MKKAVPIFLVLLLAGSAVAQDKTLIVPGKSVGPITRTTTRVGLNKLFGAANVKDGKIYGPEGESTPGTIVFPKDPKRKLEITWTSKKRIGVVSMDGTSSVYKTAEGITLGTTLQRLEELNGKPFKFSGVGWDYGGLIQSWEGGKLDKGLKNIWPRLSVLTGTPEPTQADFDAVSGDRTVWSNEAAQKKNMTIHVTELAVELNRD
jgi:hypothetical protein